MDTVLSKVRSSGCRCCPQWRGGFVGAIYYMAAYFSFGFNSSFENTVHVDVQEMKNKRRKLSNDAFQAEDVIDICLNEREHYFSKLRLTHHHCLKIIVCVSLQMCAHGLNFAFKKKERKKVTLHGSCWYRFYHNSFNHSSIGRLFLPIIFISLK